MGRFINRNIDNYRSPVERLDGDSHVYFMLLTNLLIYKQNTMNRFKFFLMSTLFFGFVFSSCNKNDDEPLVFPSITLSDTVLELQVGDKTILTATFSFDSPYYFYGSWHSDDYYITDLDYDHNDSKQCVVQAVGVGETTIDMTGHFKYCENNPTATCRVIVKPKKYTVSFDLKGGSGDFPAQLVEEGQCAVKPETLPTKDGYTFLGWGYEENVNDYWFVDFSRSITEDITFCARWKEKVDFEYVDLGVEVDGEKILWANVDAYRFYEKYWDDFTEDDLNQLPSQKEWEALSEQCYWVWHQESPQGMYVFKAHQGYKSQKHKCASSFGDYNTETDPYIFLPSDGYIRCYYWTGTPVDGEDNSFYSLACTPDNWNCSGFNKKGYPWCVRFVKRSK